MKIYDFNGFPETHKAYGGMAGQKHGIFINGERWLIKYPTRTDFMRGVKIPFTRAPLTEYLGSHVYGILGYPVHKTALGIEGGQVVVACKDFEEIGLDFCEFKLAKNLKNEKVRKYFEDHRDFTAETVNLECVLSVVTEGLENNGITGTEQRFWDQFVVDAFISNSDRNNGNWGYLVSVTTGETSVAPVYDNAGSFFDKKSDEDFADYLRDSRILHDNAIPGVVSIYKYTKGDRELPIHSFQFMDKHHEEYPMLEDAIIRNSELIDERMEEIRAMIEDIPASVVHEGKEYPIMSDVYKEYVLQILDIRRDKLHELAEEINLQREEEQFLLNGNYER